MKLVSKSLVIHPFLFAIFPIVFIYSHNIHELQIKFIVIPILLILFVIIVILLLLKLLFKSSTKAGIVLSFMLILFIVYGNLHTELFGFEIAGINVGSNTILVIPFLIIFGSGIYFLVKTKNKLENPSKLFNVVSITLIVVVSLNAGLYYAQNPEIKHSESLEILSLPNVEQSILPDIYYIILDEYAGSISLKKDFNFDNSDFILALSERDFYIPSTSYSNYPNTILSVPSTLNMQYLNFLGEEVGVESKDQRLVREIWNNNLVMKNLKSKGYHITSFYEGMGAGVEGSLDLLDERLCGDDYVNDDLKRELVTTYIPLSYFYDELLISETRSKLLCIFSELTEIKERTTQPVFVYAHMKIPHDPYVFDSDGNPVSLTKKNADSATQKKLYLEQLMFANKKIIEVVDTIFEKSENPPIIIIQSDHGERTGIDWENPTNEMIRKGHNNLNAYYLPNGSKSLYETISPVNSFRVIFNEYFNADFELLEDKYYWESLDRPFDIRDVTEILMNLNNS